MVGSHRGLGFGRMRLHAAEIEGKGGGVCKLTLEVLSGSTAACRLCESLDFVEYQPDPSIGQRLFHAEVAVALFSAAII